MITRENIGELAKFESLEGCALSFYYQPSTPKNKSHREEGILVKDLVREALREAEKAGRNGCARADLERILEMAERLHGNGGRAKAVFACAEKGFWREFDLPPQLYETRLFMNRNFHLRPLTALAEVLPRYAIVLVDKSKARFFILHMEELRETEGFVNKMPRRGRSDGFEGYDAGHAERHVEHETQQHLKQVADHLLDLKQRNAFEKLIVGTREENWSEFEPLLHTYVRTHLIGRFTIDPATASPEQVREQAERLISGFRSSRLEGLLREVVGKAHRNGRGALGIRRVLRSLETGEVQTLLLSKDFAAPGVRCRNCDHVDIGEHELCTVCGGEVQQLSDLSDVLLRTAVRNGIEIVHVPPSEAFAKVGNVAALLRFRADQNATAKLAS
jgi:peptide chain release factor subunit 1